MRDFIKIFLREKTQINPKRLNKQIKEVIISSCPAGIDKEFLYSKTLFDIAGNRTDFKKYQTGKLVVWEKYNYQDDKLVEMLEGKSKWKSGSYNEKDFEFLSKPVIEAEETGIVYINEEYQKTISTFFLSGELETRKTFNDQGICIELTEFSKKNTITNKETYDSAGQLLEARRYNSDGTALNYTVNTYDNQSRLCRSVSVSRTGYLTHDVILKYNSNGMLLETIEHPVDAENAFADLKDGSSGYGHKYSYLNENLIDTDFFYQCGELIMRYKYSYKFW